MHFMFLVCLVFFLERAYWGFLDSKHTRTEVRVYLDYGEHLPNKRAIFGSYRKTLPTLKTYCTPSLGLLLTSRFSATLFTPMAALGCLGQPHVWYPQSIPQACICHEACRSSWVSSLHIFVYFWSVCVRCVYASYGSMWGYVDGFTPFFLGTAIRPSLTGKTCCTPDRPMKRNMEQA